MSKICHICSGHSVSDTRVFERECVSLSKNGFEVHLIASCDQNKKYINEGVHIHPVPRIQSSIQRIKRRAHIADISKKINPDIFHVHEPELLNAVIRVSKNKPVIWDVHESYLDVLSERDWIPKLLRPSVIKYWDYKEKKLVKKCSEIIVVTERIAQRYLDLDCSVTIIGNYPDFELLNKYNADNRSKKTCIFVGSLGPDRGLSQIIKALGILRTKQIKLNFKFAGPIEKSYLKFLLDLAIKEQVQSQVSYHGILSRSEAIDFQNKGSFGLVTYLPTKNAMSSMPNKLIECMGLGLPVIFSNFQNYLEITKNRECGIAVNPLDHEEIANSMRCFVENEKAAKLMGANGRKKVKEVYNWHNEERKLIKLYNRIQKNKL